MLCFSGLDLVGELLTGGQRRGVTWLAVGSGDPGWDASGIPAPDRSRTSLTAEVLRVPLVPGTDITYAGGVLDVRTTLGPGMATGALRELGLFGGDASARPGSGHLVTYKAHDRIDKGPGDSVPREVRLTLPAGLLPGARDLVGGLLARGAGLVTGLDAGVVAGPDAGLRGISVIALGTDGTAPAGPPTELRAEVYRALLGRSDLVYDRARREVVATLRLDLGEGPEVVAEAGLLGGDASLDPGTGLLVQRQTMAVIDRSRPRRLVGRFVVSLVAPTPVAVPDVVGSTVAAARKTIADAGLVVASVELADGGPATPGTVIRQDPTAKSSVPEGTPVTLTEAAAVTVPVPDVLGLALATAEEALTHVGLVVGQTSEDETETARGTIVATVPAPGTRVVAGSAVGLTVATPPVRPVPDVLGRTTASAEVVLLAAGFRLAPPPYAVVEGGSTPGSVVAQDPVAGTQAPVDKLVAVTVSAPFLVPVPDLEGHTPADAAALLRDAADPVLQGLGRPPDPPGLALGATSSRPASGDEVEGTVVSQVPAAGDHVPLYTAVQVVLAGSASGAVPDLHGLALGPATAALNAAGFSLGVVAHRAVDSGVDEVVGQDPAAGATWPAGGRVGVSVGVPVMVVVPDLSGLDQAAAAEGLASRGLVLGGATPVATGPGTTPGQVLGQEPAAGTSVAKGSSVAINVAEGMPDLTGRSEADAVAAVTALGLTPVVSQEPSTAPAGTVVRQDPAPGSPTSAGQKVSLMVAVPPPVKVPDLKGIQFPDAQAKLASIGLVLVAGGSQEDGSVAAGAVLLLDPPAGTTVASGSTVTATLAIAPPVIVEVPKLTDMLVSQAKTVAGSAQLRLVVTGSQPTPGTPADTVLTQDPPAGAKVRAASTVSVVVASLDTSVVVPDLRSLDQGRAQAIAGQAGLGFTVTDSTLAAGAAGIVLSQAPLPGIRVQAGSVIGVVVSLAGGFVPDVRGDDISSATATLQQAGFRVQSTTRRILGGDFTVITQNPAPGTLAPTGSTVAVVISAPPIKPPIDTGGHHGPILDGPVPIGPLLTGPVISQPITTGPIVSGPFIAGHTGLKAELPDAAVEPGSEPDQ